MDQPARAFPDFDLTTFLGALAHDLANPLNAISMNAELARLLSEKQQPERIREVTDRVLADCGRCSRFLRDLRHFADALKPRARERLSVRALTEGAEVLARATAATKFPEFALEDGDFSVDGDRIALESALGALLRNASEAGASAVTLRASAHDDKLALSVIDNGSGIAPALAHKVGQPFFTTRRAQGNTGLGVLLARCVARSHGGTLDFARHGDIGTVATLQIGNV